MSGLRNNRTLRFKLAVRAAGWLAMLLSIHPAAAETVEVAPGVQVTKRTYSAPVNEQPFFGFVVKDAAQQAADRSFVKAVIEAAGTPEKAFDETTKRGWRAIAAGNAAVAAQRFNQAFLLAPEQSRVYHGFAAIAQIRFRDLDFAEELFRIASKQPNPLKTLNADFGRALLIAKRPQDAQAGAGAGGQGRSGFRRRMDKSGLGPAAKRRPRCGLRRGGRSHQATPVPQRQHRSDRLA